MTPVLENERISVLHPGLMRLLLDEPSSDLVGNVRRRGIWQFLGSGAVSANPESAWTQWVAHQLDSMCLATAPFQTDPDICRMARHVFDPAIVVTPKGQV